MRNSSTPVMAPRLWEELRRRHVPCFRRKAVPEGPEAQAPELAGAKHVGGDEEHATERFTQREGDHITRHIAPIADRGAQAFAARKLEQRLLAADQLFNPAEALHRGAHLELLATGRVEQR